MNTPGSWKHISNQIGMFSFTGLKAEAVDALAAKASIYMWACCQLCRWLHGNRIERFVPEHRTRDGRISMAGLNKNNLEYFAENVSKAVKGELGDSTHGAPTKPPKGSAPEPAQGAN
jgi:aspartate aminotransferase